MPGIYWRVQGPERYRRHSGFDCGVSRYALRQRGRAAGGRAAEVARKEGLRLSFKYRVLTCASRDARRSCLVAIDIASPTEPLHEIGREALFARL